MVVGQETEYNGQPGSLENFHLQRRFFKEPLAQKMQGKDPKAVCYSLIDLLASPKRKFIRSARSPLRNAMNRFLGGHNHDRPGRLQIIVEESPEGGYVLPTYSPAGESPGTIIIPDNFHTLLAVNPEQQMHGLIEAVCSLVNSGADNEYLDNRKAEFNMAVSYITKGWKDIKEEYRVSWALSNKLEIWTGKIK